MVKVLEKNTLKGIFKLAKDFNRLQPSPVFFSYDKGADVLYISFTKPQKATHSDMKDDGVIINYRNSYIVGVTILEASKR